MWLKVEGNFILLLLRFVRSLLLLFEYSLTYDKFDQRGRKKGSVCFRPFFPTPHSCAVLCCSRCEKLNYDDDGYCAESATDSRFTQISTNFTIFHCVKICTMRLSVNYKLPESFVPHPISQCLSFSFNVCETKQLLKCWKFTLQTNYLNIYSYTHFLSSFDIAE